MDTVCQRRPGQVFLLAAGSRLAESCPMLRRFLRSSSDLGQKRRTYSLTAKELAATLNLPRAPLPQRANNHMEREELYRPQISVELYERQQVYEPFRTGIFYHHSRVALMRQALSFTMGHHSQMETFTLVENILSLNIKATL